MSSADVELADAAALTEAGGLAAPVIVERLSGGKNNRVFAVTLADGRQSVMKSYHHDPRDQRDRLGAEWRFLSYAWQRGIRNVPQPLASLPERHLGLYTFVAGERPTAVTAELVSDAAAFITALNAEPRDPGELAPGSEACFSLADHLGTVSRRVARLTTLDDGAPHAGAAADFVAGRLRPSWDTVSARIEAAIDERGVDATGHIANPIVSPSDFGFHNALVSARHTSFIDFEYAGRDDPAKLVCDFFCQPEIPVPAEHFAGFRDRIVAALKLGPEDAWRCDLLLDAYRIKWVCIILNEFLPLGASRRAFADQSDRAARAQRQLARAGRQLSLVST